MPELPEVETVRHGLQQLVATKTIHQVDILWQRIVTTTQSIEDWCQWLQGQTIHSISRRAKYLVFNLSKGHLVSHLRMEGKFHYYDRDGIPTFLPKHVHAIFTFTDGSQLHYEDVRKFGRFEWVQQEGLQTFFQSKKLGPEPVASEFEVHTFEKGLCALKRPIKPVLLEQKLVVGLGNIYVDETLFRAKIHPQTLASQLTTEQIHSLHERIIEVLAEAVEAGGSTIRTYLNSLGEAGSFQTALAVYGRTGEPCIVCGTLIEKIKLAQRGTHFCPECQKGDCHV